MSSKVTWGLAWTGLALVLAIPSLDFVTGQLGGSERSSAIMTSDIDPVRPATQTASAPEAPRVIDPAALPDPAATSTGVTTIRTERGVTIVPAGSRVPDDPVENYLSSGKALPDYISGGDGNPAPATSAPATPSAPATTATPTPSSSTATQVATANPEPVLPRMPLPASARPAPLPPAASTAVTRPAAPAANTTQQQPALIIDDTISTGSISSPAAPRPPALVDDTENWETESLRQYLERRGILEGGSSSRDSSARVTERNSTYDPNGFYFDEGPNSGRATRDTRRERILRMLEEDDPQSFTLF